MGCAKQNRPSILRTAETALMNARPPPCGRAAICAECLTLSSRGRTYPRAFPRDTPTRGLGGEHHKVPGAAAKCGRAAEDAVVVIMSLVGDFELSPEAVERDVVFGDLARARASRPSAQRAWALSMPRAARARAAPACVCARTRAPLDASKASGRIFRNTHDQSCGGSKLYVRPLSRNAPVC